MGKQEKAKKEQRTVPLFVRLPRNVAAKLRAEAAAERRAVGAQLEHLLERAWRSEAA